MRRKILICGFSFLLTGCGAPYRNDPVALVRKYGNGGYEIQLTSSVRTFGLPGLLGKRIPWTRWLYTPKVEGEIPANQLILSEKQGTTESPYIQQALKGSASFSGAKMRLSLEVPIFLDGESIDHYERSRLNGVYKLRFR